MKVLIVEDNPSTRMLLDGILRARGHDVVACANAEEALLAYSPEAFPLVLLDWQLPGMDGLELCRRIRVMPGGDRSFLLMITARNQAQDLRAVLEAGADDYVAKPFEVDSLNVRFTVAEGAVHTLLERKRAEAELARTLTRLERSNDDLLSILDKFGAGAVLLDADGRITFANALANRLLGWNGGQAVGQAWERAVPLTREEAQALRDVAACAEESRSKLTTQIDGTGDRRWLAFDIKDDPRDPRGKILFVYDESDLHRLRLLLDEKARFHDLVGRSPAMMDVFEQIRRVAQVDSTVLIEGETGTGKELAARAIHFSGHRRNHPFVAVNCAGLTDSLLASQLFGHRRGAFTGAIADHKGFFETANQGTLFLDEIGDIPMTVQTNLLRVLQEREILRLGDSIPRKVDARVVAATHHNLAADAQTGQFRSDLLYRIRVARILLPPLRQRREDIPLLMQTFLGQLSAMREEAVEGVSQEALRYLMEYEWPGNVRELRAATEYAVIRCRGVVLQPEDLPPEVVGQGFAAPVGLPAASGDDENARILRMLEEVKGNRSLAAQRLGMSRSTFYRRLSELGLASATKR